MNDGYSAEEVAAPPARRELREEEKIDLAYSTWIATGSRAKVKRALGLKTDRAVNVILNRAIEEHREERAERREQLFSLMDERFTRVLVKLFDEFDGADGDGARDRINELVRVADRLAKLHGTDAREEINVNLGPQVIDARLPWERGADVESTAEPVVELEAGDAE